MRLHLKFVLRANVHRQCRTGGGRETPHSKQKFGCLLPSVPAPSQNGSICRSPTQRPAWLEERCEDRTAHPTRAAYGCFRWTSASDLRLRGLVVGLGPCISGST